MFLLLCSRSLWPGRESFTTPASIRGRGPTPPCWSEDTLWVIITASSCFSSTQGSYWPECVNQRFSDCGEGERWGEGDRGPQVKQVLVAPAGRKKDRCKPYAGLRYVQLCDKYFHLLHHLKLRLGAATPSLDDAAHFRVAFYCDESKAHLCTNQHPDTSHLSGGWIILAKKCSLTQI